jgi:hypothetical protein
MPTFHYDAIDGSFMMKGHGRANDPSTVVFVPREVSGQITVGGGVQAVVSRETDGSRLVLASPAGGNFVIAVAPAPLALTGC